MPSIPCFYANRGRIFSRRLSIFFFKIIDLQAFEFQIHEGPACGRPFEQHY
jgi:hypothetical protein